MCAGRVQDAGGARVRMTDQGEQPGKLRPLHIGSERAGSRAQCGLGLGCGETWLSLPRSSEKLEAPTLLQSRPPLPYFPPTAHRCVPHAPTQSPMATPLSSHPCLHSPSSPQPPHVPPRPVPTPPPKTRHLRSSLSPSKCVHMLAHSRVSLQLCRS